MPAHAPPSVVDRFDRLHGLSAAILRLFASGDWTLERGRAVEAELRALLLTWTWSRPGEGDEGVAAVQDALRTVDVFDPAVAADRGPFVERLLWLRDRSMLEAAAQPGWRQRTWASPCTARPARQPDQPPFAGWLSRAFTRLHQADGAFDDHTIVSVTDRHGVIVEVNDAFCRVSGHDRDELLGAKHSMLKSGRHPAAFYEELWRTIAAGRIWLGEICNRRKDGSYYWVRSTIIPLPDATDTPQEYVSVHTEITADKWALEHLALLERAVQADVSGCVIIADALRPELPISYASPSFMRLFAHAADELPGTSLRALFAGGQSAGTFDALETLLGSTDGGSLLLRWTRADGSHRTLDVRLSPVLQAGVRTHVVGVVADVTELETTREALRDRDERLRRSQELAGIGTWKGHIATRRLDCSEWTAALFGLPPAATEASYEDFLAAVHPHDRQQIVDALEACLTLDKPYDVEHRCVWPDGTVRWMSVRGQVVRDDRGRPVRMLGVVQDVSERRRLAAELGYAQERLARTQALARLGDWRIDETSGEAWWSTTLHTIYHRDPSSFRPRADTFARAADPRDRKRVEEALETVRDGSDADCLHRIALPNGECRWVRLRAQPEREASGRIFALVGTVHDVTDAMHNEDCARLLRRVLAMDENAVALADRHGELLYANRAWQRMLGHEPTVRPRGSLLAACEAPERETLERAIQRRDPDFRYRGDLPMRRVDGTLFVARGEIAVSHDTHGDVQYFVQQFHDADEALAHERALADAHARIQDAREAGHRLVARMSGALRGPSQTVLAFARLLAARAELPAVSQQYLRHILEAGRRVLRIGGEALDLARTEAGRLCWRIGPTALDEVLGALAEPGIGGEPVSIRVSILSGERLAVRCDPMRLLQALRTLIAGASRCSLVATRVRAPGDAAPAIDSDDRIELRIVRDTLASARADAGADDWHDALRFAGLLLAPMGGTIETRTDAKRPTAGGVSGACIATLALRLASAPLPPAAIAPAPPAADAKTDARPAPLRRSVLHIDDDDTSLSLLQEVFHDDPRVHVLLSPSAMLGVDLAQSKRPDAVLLDVDSPAIDAFAVLHELKVDPRTRDIPVIALTADVAESNRRRIDGCGFFRFVEKPLSVPELLRTIDAAFRVRRGTG